MIFKSLLEETDVRQKLRALEGEVHGLLLRGPADRQHFSVPHLPGRDVMICLPSQMPPKAGLSTSEGQARMLHDLGHIELQAMELCVRSLIEFPEADSIFREQLAHIALDEGRHLKGCLDALDEMGCPWGTYPGHLGLWLATSADDDLMDRLLIVHRYLEGSGLDAGDRLLQRLDGVRDYGVSEVVRLIHREELGHVQFGSRWFQSFALQQRADPGRLFVERMQVLKVRLPRRLERIQRRLREQAGFSPQELDFLTELQKEQLVLCEPPKPN